MGHPTPLTRFNRACSKRLVGPDGTFYLFAELPCEIRLMIWKECIPSQIHLVAERIHDGYAPWQLQRNPHIVESTERFYESTIDSRKWPYWPPGNDPRTEIYDSVMDALQGEHFNLSHRAYPYHSRYCTPAYPESFRQKTPVIAKVNQEARALAFERMSKCYNLAFVHKDLDEWMDRIEESPVWLNAKSDNVLINTQYITATSHPTDAVLVTRDRRIDHKEDRLFGMITRNKIKVAIFAAALIDSVARPRLYHALTNANRVDVVVGVIRFDRMSDSEAAITEIFGLFGEESMALVPVNNSRALLKLFKAHAAFRPQCVAEFFDWDQAEHMKQNYIPDRHLKDRRRSPSELDLNWDRSRRPSDFREYCEDMRGFASSIMTACETELMSRHFAGADGEAKGRQWQTKVEATFQDTFEPVLLAHRCRNPVLIDLRKQES